MYGKWSKRMLEKSTKYEIVIADALSRNDIGGACQLAQKLWGHAEIVPVPSAMLEAIQAAEKIVDKQAT